jgi:hypothetical protein
MIYRTLNEIIDAAVVSALQRFNSCAPKTKNKYRYKEDLKSRRGKK